MPSSASLRVNKDRNRDRERHRHREEDRDRGRDRDRTRNRDREDHDRERRRDRDRHGGSGTSSSRDHRERDRTSRRHSDRDRGRERADRHTRQTPPTVSSNVLKAAIGDITKTLMQEASFNVASVVGKFMRRGVLELLGVLDDVPSDYQVIVAPGMDIFGEPLAKKHNFECECPRCHRTLAAQRFAPHLEKCMGMGRNSSRIASKRLAQGSSSSQASQNGNGGSVIGTSGQGSEKSHASQASTVHSGSSSHHHAHNGELQSEEEHCEEDEDDEDWTMERRKKSSKKVIEKISPKSRKGPLHRLKTSEAFGGFRGRRGASPSVMDSPSSLADSFHDDDEFASLSIG